MILNQFPDKERFMKLAGSSNVVPLCMEDPCRHGDPRYPYLKNCIEKDAPLFLLESVEGGERWARYSFLGIGANSEIRVFSDRVEIVSDKGCQTIAHDNDPLTVLREITDNYRPCEIPELPRFWSGLTGYLTYENGPFF